MTDAVIIAVVAAVPPTLLGLATLIVSLRSNRKVEAVHVATNSMKDALVAAARKIGISEGRALEQRDQSDRAENLRKESK